MDTRGSTNACRKTPKPFQQTSKLERFCKRHSHYYLLVSNCLHCNPETTLCISDSSLESKSSKGMVILSGGKASFSPLFCCKFDRGRDISHMIRTQAHIDQNNLCALQGFSPRLLGKKNPPQKNIQHLECMAGANAW